MVKINVTPTIICEHDKHSKGRIQEIVKVSKRYAELTAQVFWQLFEIVNGLIVIIKS